MQLLGVRQSDDPRHCGVDDAESVLFEGGADPVVGRLARHQDRGQDGLGAHRPSLLPAAVCVPGVSL